MTQTKWSPAKPERFSPRFEERLGIGGESLATLLKCGQRRRAASSGMMRIESAVESRGQRIHPLPQSELQIMNVGAIGKAADRLA